MCFQGQVDLGCFQVAMYEGWLGLGQIEGREPREQLIDAALPMESLGFPCCGEVCLQAQVLHQVLGDAGRQMACVNAGGIQAEMAPSPKHTIVIQSNQIKNFGRGPALADPRFRHTTI